MKRRVQKRFKRKSPPEPRRFWKYSALILICPLLWGFNHAPSEHGFHDPLKTRSQRLVEHLSQEVNGLEVSVYFKDLNSGMSFGINEEKKFPHGSLGKLPYLMGILKSAENDPGLLAQTVKLRPTAIVELAQSGPAEQSYTVERLLWRLIVRSDNAALLALSTAVPPALLLKAYQDLAVEYGTSGELSAKEYSRFLEALARHDYLNSLFSEKALNLLTLTEFRSGLVEGVPGSIRVAHKWGSVGEPLSQLLHDCGIVYYPNHPYLICIMTRARADSGVLSSVIARISRQVYDDFSERLSAINVD